MKALFPHAAQTREVTVRVSVSFHAEQSEPRKGRWFWAETVIPLLDQLIENSGSRAVQLISRHWKITDGRGVRHDVRGEGVVGEQPVIEPGDSYDYVSGCPLHTPTGAMEGSFRMVGADGSSFNAAIPRFPLIGPAVAR